jgi:hypothetical protein
LNGWVLAYREDSLDYIDAEIEGERKKAGARKANLISRGTGGLVPDKRWKLLHF